jgi:hypothetical protein
MTFAIVSMLPLEPATLVERSTTLQDNGEPGDWEILETHRS